MHSVFIFRKVIKKFDRKNSKVSAEGFLRSDAMTPSISEVDVLELFQI
jgi:hypothetical protein